MELIWARATESGLKIPVTITSTLAWAVLEWVLMFMIILDAGFWYLVTRFSHHFHLQIPCLLCSRLDNVWKNESSDFYRDSICRRHKRKISSLVLCQIHNKLVDVHETCESCLLNKSSSEMCRHIVYELGAGPHDGPAQSYSGKCICCDEQRVSQTWAHEFFQRVSIEPQRSDMELLNLGYSKVKVTSDSRSEILFSDTDSDGTLIREVETSCMDLQTKNLSDEPQILTLADDGPAPQLKASIYESMDLSNSRHNVELETPLDCGSEELKWKEIEHSTDICKPYETVSFSEILPSPDIDGTSYDESRRTEPTAEWEKNKPSSATAEVSTDLGETPMATSEPSSRNETQNDPKPNTSPQSLDLGDAYRLAITGARVRQLSGKFLEQQKSMAESTRASEDLKILLSQLSAANSEDQLVQRRISLERNESGLSLDGTALSEIEGESPLDRLKRQVEHDRRIISGLYRELEEERSAAAVAASQAMAMITRLQEEKAALHMEALQYLRMMEEQAEYDGEALQKANALLAEKERWTQELEWELGPGKARTGDSPSSD